MKSAYPKVRRLAKLDGVKFQRDLEALCHAKAGELLQAYLEAEVDDLLERAVTSVAIEASRAPIATGTTENVKSSLAAVPLRCGVLACAASSTNRPCCRSFVAAWRPLTAA